jgi:carbon-monoxide dehydrogenase large subunit
MDRNRITLRTDDPAAPALMGAGTIGSRSMMAHGGGSAAAARAVIEKGIALAALELGVSAAEITFDRGRYRARGANGTVSLERLVRRYAGASPHPLDAVGDIPSPKSAPGGAHVAEVEVDPQTGAVRILAYTAVDDCGRVLNHTLLEGQLHGGIIQGMGQVLGEHCAYDSSGQLLAGTFMDYVMPRAGIAQNIRLYDHSAPSPGNPLGVKGAGEAGTTGALPALALAIMDALRPLGIHQLDLPYTPARIWRAIESARAGEPVQAPR